MAHPQACPQASMESQQAEGFDKVLSSPATQPNTSLRTKKEQGVKGFNDSADNSLTVGSAEAAFLQIAWNNSQTDDNLSGVFYIIGDNIPSETTITNVSTSGTTTTITMSAASTAAVTSYVIVTGGAGGSNLFMDENNPDESLIKTTATVEQHGDEYVIRRPILQKVELNEDSTRTILHFDRRVFPDNIDTSQNKNQCLALFDPLTIKQIETENDGALVYQKIKMSHEHDFNANDQIVIQNLEEQPIAVTTGLTVLETDPVKSNLDIFYESSTSGLIKDLHNDIELNNNELEISYYNTFILSGGGNIVPVLQNGTITDKVGQWHVEESRIKGEFNGKSVDFRNTILIMTTNAGAQELSKAAIGFKQENREGADSEAIDKLFAPEFRNRLDAIIPFGYLPLEVVRMVVDKFIMQLEAQLSEKGVSVVLTDKARDWLATKGYDKTFGARPLGRVIQEHIKKPLAEELLFGRLVDGGVVYVDLSKDKLTLKTEGSASKDKKKKTIDPKNKSNDATELT